MRGRDSHILYIGDVRFVDDARFELLRERKNNLDSLEEPRRRGSSSSAPSLARGDWTLKVRFVQAEDEGDFECQLSTSPKLSKTFKINVVGESAGARAGFTAGLAELQFIKNVSCHIRNVYMER